MSSLGTSHLDTATTQNNARWYVQHKWHIWIVTAAHSWQLQGKKPEQIIKFIIYAFTHYTEFSYEYKAQVLYSII